MHDDTEVTLKRNPYEPDYGELTRKGKSARQNARVDSYKSAEPHKICMHVCFAHMA